MTTRARVTFQSFDTTSEVSGLDGSTFTVALVGYRVDHSSGSFEGTASVGVSSRGGRRSYELIEPALAGKTPFAEAVVEYVRCSEKALHLADLDLDASGVPAARAIELELDLELQFGQDGRRPIPLATT